MITIRYGWRWGASFACIGFRNLRAESEQVYPAFIREVGFFLVKNPVQHLRRSIQFSDSALPCRLKSQSHVPKTGTWGTRRGQSLGIRRIRVTLGMPAIAYLECAR